MTVRTVVLVLVMLQAITSAVTAGEAGRQGGHAMSGSQCDSADAGCRGGR
ncbi:MAG: hypothetical protein QM699_08975 [Amaricoccus sp.]